MNAADLTVESQSRFSRRWLALVAVCLAQLMVMLDASVVNVALPLVQKDLHFTQANLTWVVNAYGVTFGGFLLMAGRLGDLLGRKWLFLGGLVLFVAASVACGLSTDQTLLIGARAVQGLGGAIASAATLAILITEFRQPHERAQALSVFTFVISSGGALGLLVGGLVTQWVNWHWVFYINVPVGLVAFVASAILVRSEPGIGLDHGLDVLGSLLVTAGASLGIFAIVRSADYGWLSAETLGLGAVAIALLAAFVAWESRAKNPIMPLHILVAGNLLRASVIRSFLVAGMFATFFLGALYLQHVLGYGAIKTGLAFLPLPLGITVMSLGLTTRVMERLGPKPTLIIGLLIAVAGLLLLSRAGVDAPYFPNLAVPFVLMGFGMPLAMMPLVVLAVNGVRPQDSGLASGIINAFTQLAAAVGISTLGTIATHRMTDLLHSGHSVAYALTGGSQLGFAVGAASAAVGLLLAIVTIRSPRRPQPVAEREPAREPLRQAS